MKNFVLDSAEAFRSWSDNDLTGLADRIKRTLLADEDYRLPSVTTHSSMACSMMRPAA